MEKGENVDEKKKIVNGRRQSCNNLFWVYQNGNFLPGKKASRRVKKSEKITLPPQKNVPVTPLLLKLGYVDKNMFMGIKLYLFFVLHNY